MAANRARREALLRDPRIQQFLIANVKPTGKKLGSGAYGSVEELEIDGVFCAGKKIHEALLEHGTAGVQNLVRKYVEECQLLSNLRHPHIVQFIGLCFFDDSSLPVLIMELLHASLDDLLENTPDIPLAIKRSILADVAKGLAYLHNRNPPIIHRDLSAKNVLLNSAMVAKISDMGNSRIVLLQPGQLARTMSSTPGTLVYMPPEAFESTSRYGPALDIFSYGVLALFTLTQVFPGDLKAHNYPDPTNMERLIGRTEVERRGDYIDTLHAKLGDRHPLVQLVKECLRNIPARRPTAEVLIQQLVAVQIDDPHQNLTKVEMMKLLKEKNDQIQQLQAQIEHRDRDRDIRALQVGMEQMAADLQHKDRYIRALQVEKLALQGELEVNGDLLGRLQLENDTMRIDLGVLQSELEEEAANKRALQVEVSRLQTDQEERDRKMAVMFSELEDKEAIIEVLQSEQEERHVEVQQKEDEIHRVEGELRDAQSFTTRIQTELQESRNLLESMRTELRDTRAELEVKVGYITEKDNTVKKLENDMQELRSHQTQPQNMQGHLGSQHVSPKSMSKANNAATRRFTRRASSPGGNFFPSTAVPRQPSASPFNLMAVDEDEPRFHHSTLRSHSLDMGETSLDVPLNRLLQTKQVVGDGATQPIFPTVNYIGPFINQTFDVRGGILPRNEYGVSLIIPRAAIMGVMNVSVGCCIRGPFVMPKGHELVSPVYFVSPSGVIFAIPVKVSIDHWAQIASNLHFMWAPSCDGDEGHYHFQPLEGGFFESHKGQVSVQQFGWFAIARSTGALAKPQPLNKSDLNTGECGNDYIALLYQPVSHNPNESWTVVFSVCLRHPACGTALKNHLSNTFGIKFMVSQMGVQLDGDVTLMIPEEATECGFEIRPDLRPCLIRKKDMDLPCRDFGSNADDTYPPRVHLTVNALHEPRGECPLRLAGTSDRDPRRHFILRVPQPYQETRGRTIQDDLLQRKPDVKGFMNMVGARIPYKWREVGCELGVTHDQMDTINENERGNQIRCFTEVFRTWKKESDNCTWSAVIAALKAKQVGHVHLAGEVMQELQHSS